MILPRIDGQEASHDILTASDRAHLEGSLGLGVRQRAHCLTRLRVSEDIEGEDRGTWNEDRRQQTSDYNDN